MSRKSTGCRTPFRTTRSGRVVRPRTAGGIARILHEGDRLSEARRVHSYEQLRRGFGDADRDERKRDEQGSHDECLRLIIVEWAGASTCFSRSSFRHRRLRRQPGAASDTVAGNGRRRNDHRTRASRVGSAGIRHGRAGDLPLRHLRRQHSLRAQRRHVRFAGRSRQIRVFGTAARDVRRITHARAGRLLDTGGIVESPKSAPLRATVTGAASPAIAPPLQQGDTVTTGDGVKLAATLLASGLEDVVDLALSAGWPRRRRRARRARAHRGGASRRGRTGCRH